MLATMMTFERLLEFFPCPADGSLGFLPANPSSQGLGPNVHPFLIAELLCAHANGLLQKLLFRDSQPPRHSIQFIQDCSASLAEKIFSIG
jgi:hypothetical protein